jgi:hypothetical protein
MAAVRDPNDSALGFIASCLPYALRGALTKKQAVACNKIWHRLYAA